MSDEAPSDVLRKAGMLTRTSLRAPREQPERAIAPAAATRRRLRRKQVGGDRCDGACSGRRCSQAVQPRAGQCDEVRAHAAQRSTAGNVPFAVRSASPRPSSWTRLLRGRPVVFTAAAGEAKASIAPIVFAHSLQNGALHELRASDDRESDVMHLAAKFNAFRQNIRN